jgi:hypothetical protein
VLLLFGSIVRNLKRMGNAVKVSCADRTKKMQNLMGIKPKTQTCDRQGTEQIESKFHQAP